MRKIYLRREDGGEELVFLGAPATGNPEEDEKLEWSHLLNLVQVTMGWDVTSIICGRVNELEERVAELENQVADLTGGGL